MMDLDVEYFGDLDVGISLMKVSFWFTCDILRSNKNTSWMKIQMDVDAF